MILAVRDFICVDIRDVFAQSWWIEISSSAIFIMFSFLEAKQPFDMIKVDWRFCNLTWKQWQHLQIRYNLTQRCDSTKQFSKINIWPSNIREIIWAAYGALPWLNNCCQSLSSTFIFNWTVTNCYNFFHLKLK